MKTKKQFCEFAQRSYSSVQDFAHFVSYAEFFAENHSKWFVSEEDKKLYSEVWFSMETLNAFAFDEWDGDGRPDDWTKKWNKDYLHSVKELINKFCQIKSLSELYLCPACERNTLNSMNDFEVCTLCGWIDDPAQSEDPSNECGENMISLDTYRMCLKGNM